MFSVRGLCILLMALLVSCAGAEVRYPAEPVDEAPYAAASGDSTDTKAAEDVEDVSVFYDALAPYGNWVSTPEYGQVWIPRDVPADWRPYTYGRWVYTDYGWTWVAQEEWGWAPFHYGRWTYLSSHGWGWIPGTVWAPAWVAWRHGPGWVGWAPLPPHVALPPGGVITHVEVIPPFWFAFVEERWLVRPYIHTYIALPARNVTLIHVTQNVTHYVVVHKRVVNRCIPVQRIERVTAQRVPRLRVVEREDSARVRRAEVKDHEREVVVYRPKARGPRQSTSTTASTPTAPAQTTPDAGRPRRQLEESSSNLRSTPSRSHLPQSQPPDLTPGSTPERRQQRFLTTPRKQEDDEDSRTSSTPAPRQLQLPSPPPASPENPSERPQRRPLAGPRDAEERTLRTHREPGQPLGQQPPTQLPGIQQPSNRPPGAHSQEAPRLAPRPPRSLSAQPATQPPPVPQPPSQAPSASPPAVSRAPRQQPFVHQQQSLQPAYTPQHVAPARQLRHSPAQRTLPPESRFPQQQ